MLSGISCAPLSAHGIQIRLDLVPNMALVSGRVGIRRHPRAAWSLLTLALMGSACLDPSQPGLSQGQYTGWWVLHLQGGKLDSNVELVHVHAVTDPEWPLRLRVVPSLNWAGEEVKDLACTRCDGRYHEAVEWALQLEDGSFLDLRYIVTGDEVTGAYTATDRGGSASGRLWGFRVDPALLLTPVSHALGPIDDPAPRILLELDDIPPTDPPFIERLTRRSLCAQLAVITRYVGIDGRPDWPALQTWAKLGFGMAAHSRTHSANMDPDVGFMSEVVGALHDLAQHGLRTTVFVQPGSWRDSLFFDSRAKVRNWRGSLFRTFTEVTGAYVYPGWTQLPPPDSLRLGFGHITISDGMSHAAMLD